MNFDIVALTKLEDLLEQYIVHTEDLNAKNDLFEFIEDFDFSHHPGEHHCHICIAVQNLYWMFRQVADEDSQECKLRQLALDTLMA